MGQRLTIEVKRNEDDEKAICVLYFHWSGYTRTAVLETHNLIEHCLKKIDVDQTSDHEIQRAVIDYLQCVTPYGYKVRPDKEYFEKAKGLASQNDSEILRNAIVLMLDKKQCCHGGVCASDMALAIKRFGKDFIVNDDCISRSEGLVMIDEEPMGRALGWSELPVTIDLNNKSISGWWLWDETENQDGEDMEDDDDHMQIISKDSPLVLLTKDDLSYDELNSLNECLNKEKNNIDYFQIEGDPFNTIYSIIE